MIYKKHFRLFLKMPLSFLYFMYIDNQSFVYFEVL